ncbi:glycosyltransferase family A protein [Spirosoma sp. KNUC1025]|uniref:glycosyltransferase family 2 protein n=1 Tax=Spirosoma sp. KNUC1025 TaxID=2894082 RepID=UPI00386CED7F|nr:glycosyltransferase family 2 protein [Spirosoma sp. KNUC1025]
MQKPLLSVVIPTLNRVELLQLSVQALLEQIVPHADKIEFLLLNNASEDGTADWLENTFMNHPVVRYINFTERVEIADSISRCATYSIGEYLWVFGDDDLAMPFAIETIIRQLETHPTYGIFYFNCLRGERHLKEYINLFEYRIDLQPATFSLDSFISEFNPIHLGFITALVFRRDNWQNGKEFYKETYYGYNFLGPILGGNQGQPCLYYSFPIVICRLGPQRYLRKWPLYTLVGIPNILKDVANAKLTTQRPLEKWSDRQTLVGLIKTAVLAKAYDYGTSHFFWTDALTYQQGFRRTCMQWIRYGLPAWLARFIFEQFADRNTPKA